MSLNSVNKCLINYVGLPIRSCFQPGTLGGRAVTSVTSSQLGRVSIKYLNDLGDVIRSGVKLLNRRPMAIAVAAGITVIVIALAAIRSRSDSSQEDTSK